VTSKALWNFFNQPETRLLLIELQQHLPLMNKDQKSTNPLVVHKTLNENIPPEWIGKSFVFTGKMKAFSRAQVSEAHKFAKIGDNPFGSLNIIWLLIFVGTRICFKIWIIQSSNR
jgi:NAD-dependent DNA ligase